MLRFSVPVNFVKPVSGLQKKINLSKTVRKVPISADMSTKGTSMRDETLPIPQYDDVRIEICESPLDALLARRRPWCCSCIC